MTAKKQQKIAIPSEILNRKGKSSRPPQILVEQRNAEILEMLLDCKPRQMIQKFLREKYNIGNAACDELIQKGYDSIKESYTVDKEALIATHIEKYKKIVEQWDEVDPKSQIAALGAIEKLLKLSQPDVQVNNNNLTLNLKDMTLNELKQLLTP